MAISKRNKEPTSINSNARHTFRHDAQEIRFKDDVNVPQCLTSIEVKSALLELCGLVTAASVWTRVSCTVPASSSLECDSVALSGFHGMKYVVSMFSDTENKHTVLESVVSRSGPSDIKDIVLAKTGDVIDTNLTISTASGNAKLTIQNNESYDIEVSMARLLL